MTELFADPKLLVKEFAKVKSVTYCPSMKLFTKTFVELYARCSFAGIIGISWYCLYLYNESKRHQQAIRVAQQKQVSRKKYQVPEGMPLPSYMASIDEALNEELDAPVDDSQSNIKSE